MVSKVDEDIKVLIKFFKIYCETKHKHREKTSEDNIKLCSECQEILRYSIVKREYCHLDPKPPCKKCKIHCYKPIYREKIRDIMKYSGMALIKSVRIGLLIHYFF